MSFPPPYLPDVGSLGGVARILMNKVIDAMQFYIILQFYI